MLSLNGQESMHQLPPCHPLFSSSEADIVLISIEDTAYRVPRFVLRNTCGYFRRILSAGGPNSSLIKRQLDHNGLSIFLINVNEPNNALSKLLCLICGLKMDDWNSLDEVDSVLVLSQRWDAAGPISVIRSGITAPIFLADPLRLYDIASRMGWEAEAKLASTETLALGLYDEEHRGKLEMMTSTHLMDLLRLHRERRDQFKIFIDTDPTFQAYSSYSFHCNGCGEESRNNQWKELKIRMLMEMDRRPLGDTICGLGMEEWPEAIACWEAKCGNDSCRMLKYPRMETLRALKDCIHKLPTHI